MANDYSKMDKKTLQEQYDAKVKKLLSEKYILAWILKECTTEFKSFDIEKIVKEAFIGEIKVSKVAVNPDEDDIEEPTKLDTANNEDNSTKNGPIVYDIRFNVVVPDSDIPVALIINIEAQKTSETPYPLLKRALYYCSRLISSQKNVVFVNTLLLIMDIAMFVQIMMMIMNQAHAIVIHIIPIQVIQLVLNAQIIVNIVNIIYKKIE